MAAPVASVDRKLPDHKSDAPLPPARSRLPPIPASPRSGLSHQAGTLRASPKVALAASIVPITIKPYVPPQAPNGVVYTTRFFTEMEGPVETYEERMAERKMRRCVCAALIGIVVGVIGLGLTLKYA